MNKTPAMPKLSVNDMDRVSFQRLHEQHVVWFFIHHMLDKGWKLVDVDDGDDDTTVRDMAHAMETIYNLDECWLRFKMQSGPHRGKKHSVYLVMGNAPDEVIADWGYTDGDADGFNAAVSAFKPEEVARIMLGRAFGLAE